MAEQMTKPKIVNIDVAKNRLRSSNPFKQKTACKNGTKTPKR